MACAIEPHRGAQLGKVAHAECFAGASPCAPNSRAARGGRYHTTRGTTAGPNHYDACEGCPLSPVRARIAMAARNPEQCASRTPVPGSHCASCDADPWCGWHFVRVCGAMGTSRPTAYYPREIPPIPHPVVRSRCMPLPLRSVARRAIENAKILCAPIHPAPSLFVLLCVKNTRTPPPNPASRPHRRTPWCGPVVVGRDVIARGGSPLGAARVMRVRISRA